jgi:hypothetical protein
MCYLQKQDRVEVARTESMWCSEVQTSRCRPCFNIRSTSVSFSSLSHREISTPIQSVQEASAPPRQHCLELDHKGCTNILNDIYAVFSRQPHVGHLSEAHCSFTNSKPSNHNHSYSYTSPPPTAQQMLDPRYSIGCLSHRNNSVSREQTGLARPMHPHQILFTIVNRGAGCRKTAHVFRPTQSRRGK